MVYVLASVRREQEGRYTCTVSNRGGKECSTGGSGSAVRARPRA